MNMYAYVGNDPVNFTDPTGLSHCATPADKDPPVCGGKADRPASAYPSLPRRQVAQVQPARAVRRVHRPTAARPSKQVELARELCKAGPEIAGGGLGGILTERFSETVLKELRLRQDARFEKRNGEFRRVGRIARWGRVGARGGFIGVLGGMVVGHFAGELIEDQLEKVCNKIDF